VRPSFRRTIVNKEAYPALLRDLDLRRKRLQPTEAWASHGSDEHPITSLQRRIPEEISVPLFGMPCFWVSGMPRRREGHVSILLGSYAMSRVEGTSAHCRLRGTMSMRPRRICLLILTRFSRH
jgi:hypothetical protein